MGSGTNLELTRRTERNTIGAMGHTSDKKPAKDDTKSKIMSVKISEPMDDAIDTYARHRGQSKSSVVREAVAEYVVGERRTGSFTEQAADLCGIVDGPPNLSTDPGGLDGFGE